MDRSRSKEKYPLKKVGRNKYKQSRSSSLPDRPSNDVGGSPDINISVRNEEASQTSLSSPNKKVSLESQLTSFETADVASSNGQSETQGSNFSDIPKR